MLSFFFFKQKTAYEMRISDWSSDVCSSDLGPAEIDLSWWFFIDDMLSAGQPSPPGIPSRADQVAIFEEALGRPVQKLDYYGVLAALRMALVIAQTIRHLAVDGLLPSTNRPDIANPATQTGKAPCGGRV